jgi:hypothetical protein
MKTLERPQTHSNAERIGIYTTLLMPPKAINIAPKLKKLF